MIEFKCLIEDTLPYTSLLPFQGGLKSYTDEDVAKLAESLRTKGQKTPFVIWHQPVPAGTSPADWHSKQPHYVIDGHRRLMAIAKLAEHEPELLQQSYPVLFVVAETAEEAKDALLEISSQYGKITKKGLVNFLKDAPAINVAKMGIKVKLGAAKPIAPGPKPAHTHAILKLKIPREKVSEVMQVLQQVSYIEVL